MFFTTEAKEPSTSLSHSKRKFFCPFLNDTRTIPSTSQKYDRCENDNSESQSTGQTNLCENRSFTSEKLI